MVIEFQGAQFDLAENPIRDRRLRRRRARIEAELVRNKKPNNTPNSKAKDNKAITMNTFWRLMNTMEHQHWSVLHMVHVRATESRVYSIRNVG